MSPPCSSMPLTVKPDCEYTLRGWLLDVMDGFGAGLAPQAFGWLVCGQKGLRGVLFDGEGAASGETKGCNFLLTINS